MYHTRCNGLRQTIGYADQRKCCLCIWAVNIYIDCKSIETRPIVVKVVSGVMNNST